MPKSREIGGKALSPSPHLTPLITACYYPKRKVNIQVLYVVFNKGR